MFCWFSQLLLVVFFVLCVPFHISHLASIYTKSICAPFCKTVCIYVYIDVWQYVTNVKFVFVVFFFFHICFMRGWNQLIYVILYGFVLARFNSSTSTNEQTTEPDGYKNLCWWKWNLFISAFFLSSYKITT